MDSDIRYSERMDTATGAATGGLSVLIRPSRAGKIGECVGVRNGSAGCADGDAEVISAIAHINIGINFSASNKLNPTGGSGGRIAGCGPSANRIARNRD